MDSRWIERDWGERYSTHECPGTNPKGKQENKGTRDDIEGEDDQESFFKWMEDNPNAGVALNDDDEQDLDYDEEGNIIVPEKSKVWLVN